VIVVTGDSDGGFGSGESIGVLFDFEGVGDSDGACAG
jgi:hypothetical protein